MATEAPPPDAAALEVGQRVELRGKLGWVRFWGTTAFAAGWWVGVELDDGDGKNDGSVQGKVYFKCKELHGVFVRHTQVTIVPTPEKSAPTAAAAAAAATPAPAAASAAAPTPAAAAPAPTPAAAAATSTLRTPAAPTPAAATAPATASDTSAASASTAPTHPGTDREVFLLREKVTSLEAKRAEDRERMKELEKYRALHDQMTEYKTKWAHAQHELQQQLKEARREAKEATEARDKLTSEVAELSDATELATLDKEMAEEKCDSMQAEVEGLKERIEELNLDLAILRGEQEEQAAAGDGAARRPTSAETKQLEAHNERLKEALVKLRDMAAAEKHELTAKVTVLEKEAASVPDLRERNTKLSAEVADLESQVVELKQAVDDAMGVSDMVEKLTNANLDLEERVHILNEQLYDLEALRDLADELEENHVASERQLQGEIDSLSVRVHELSRALESANETIADQEASIGKYRDLLRDLQADMSELRRREVSQQEESRELATQSQSLLSLNMQLQSSASKAHARAVDLELRRLDAMQATEMATMLRSFLPESFFKSEFDGVCTVLLFHRLHFKTQMAMSQVRQQFHLDRDGLEQQQASGSNHAQSVQTLVRRESTSFAHRLFARLVDLQHIFARFSQMLRSCEVELYLKLGFMHSELVVHERKLDSILELLKREQLTDVVPLDGIDKSIAQLSYLGVSYLPSSSTASGLTPSPSSLQLSSMPQQQQQQHQQPQQPQGSSGVLYSSPASSLLTNLSDGDVLEWRCETIDICCNRALHGASAILSLIHIAPNGGSDAIAQGISSILVQAVDQLTQARDAARRIVRKMPSAAASTPATAAASASASSTGTEARIALPHGQREKIALLGQRSGLLAALFDELAQALAVGVDASAPVADQLPLAFDNWGDRIRDVVQRYMGEATSDGSAAVAHLAAEAGAVAAALGELFAALQRGDLDDTSAITASPTGTNTVAPWLYRAQILKDEAAEASQLREKLAAKSEELHATLTALKVKEKELGDSHVRAETLEKRVLSLKSECDRLEDAKAQLDAANKQVKRLDDTVKALHTDIEVYEKDISDLQRQLKTLRKTSAGTGGQTGAHTPATGLDLGLPSLGASPLGSPRRAPHDGGSGASAAMAPASVIGKYESQVEALEAAVRHLRLENASLKGQSSKLSLAELPPLAVPRTYAAVSPAAVSVSSVTPTPSTITSVAREASELVKSIQNVSTSVRVVRVAERAGKPAVADPLVQLASLQRLTSELSARAADAILTEVAGAAAPSSFGSFARPDLSHSLNVVKIGKLTIPSAGRPEAPQTVKLDSREFERLHAVFVQ
ncbi:hypothetical protein CAOG_05006 [Capsaspora owczarzaki ATCC 30864]|uniref:CAP-Gly domain-containing protein n=1 Tax=Capsaspora owczarzaki (strain ATCC 30864) TaxID=595528 RepID=A0A0D2UGX0_CAPO3|nr:hypothetical protein CAOG_05006 [Capsaspora owczarzaki ATCC 30864]KJE94351.1 hypothetical protein CAOG_005006 [Capsaspora owczarzaki ATCC 30864]|eukprot:XP_004346691.1 hypothetical protein CAOG_05006 [Capsaspora owczarzaki ATCC 30864]